MADDRTKSGTPLAEIPAIAGQLKGPSPSQVPATLASRLVPIVDKIRRLNSTFGIRPYRVYLVHVLWSGGQPGDGSETEISRREIEPTPRVRDMGGTTNVMRAYGVSEEGEVFVDQISPRFTEDDLQGLTPDLKDPALLRTDLRWSEFYWEVVENRPATPNPVRRRYVPQVPSLSRDGFQWAVRLIKQDYNRGRQGGFYRPSDN